MSTHAKSDEIPRRAPQGPDQPAGGPATMRTSSTDVWKDRIRWSAVWAGALTTLTTNIVLQLLFFSLGWLDLGTGSTTTAIVVSGVLSLIAFLLGGIAAGACALWRRTMDGMVNGIVSWALTVALLLAIALSGGGALLGYFGDVFGGFGTLNGPAVVDLARQTAGWAALGLGLSVVASALGGTVGAKLWPQRAEGAPERR